MSSQVGGMFVFKSFGCVYSRCAEVINFVLIWWWKNLVSGWVPFSGLQGLAVGMNSIAMYTV